MGIIYALAAALFFSLSHITLRKGVTRLGVSSGMIIMLLSGTASTLIIALSVEGIDFLLPINWTSILFFVLGGLVHFLGGWGFQNASASRIGPTRLSAMTGSTPLFAAVLAFITLNQSLNVYLLSGILLIMIGVGAIALGSKS